MQPEPRQLSDLVATCQRSEFLEGLPQETLVTLASGARIRYFEVGEHLLWEGEPSPGMVCLLSGQVKLFKLSSSGRELILRLVNPGEVFNEISALDGGPNPVHAAALQTGVAAYLPPPLLCQAVLRSPENAEILIRHLSQRMRFLVGALEELTFYQTNHRLARLLDRMFEEAGPDRPLRVTHKELAARLGTVREVVARGLQTLQAGGAIRLQRRQIDLLDAQRLQAWCDPKSQEQIH